MVFLYFIAALAGIVVFAIVVNRLTGTKASYLESLALDADERELWRDSEADFATLPRFGQAMAMSFPRLGRHTAVWTDERVIIAQRALGSERHLITHQIFFDGGPAAAAAREAASKFGAGFYGRGFETLLAAKHELTTVNERACVRLVLGADSSAASNLIEVYVFSEHLNALRAALT
ncbi:MAG: hypothetical protein ABUL62_17870 [Myxococcales bacterium]|jgi:hypothetical protein